MSDVSDTIIIEFKIPTVIFISILSVVLKNLVCELTDCSLCFNHWFTYIIFLVMVLMMFFIVTIFNLTPNWLNFPSTFYNSKFVWFLTFATFFHTFSLASSSFVEEEHQTWYYMTHTLLFVICIMSLKKRQNDQWFLNAELLKTDCRKKRSHARSLFEQFFFEFNWFVLLALLLVGRRLNQTGDKWLNLPDIGDFLIMEEHRISNSCFVVIC